MGSAAIAPSLRLTTTSRIAGYPLKRHSTGTTGFDLVDPCERLQAEVPGGLVKHRDQPISADHEFALAT
jgi:hypothetical protein